MTDIATMPADALALELATAFESLRVRCPGMVQRVKPLEPHYTAIGSCGVCQGRGWVAAVTLEGLLEALNVGGWMVNLWRELNRTTWACLVDGSWVVRAAYGCDTPLLAAMRAAVAALRAREATP